LDRPLSLVLGVASRPSWPGGSAHPGASGGHWPGHLAPAALGRVEDWICRCHSGACPMMRGGAAARKPPTAAVFRLAGGAPGPDLGGQSQGRNRPTTLARGRAIPTCAPTALTWVGNSRCGGTNPIGESSHDVGAGQGKSYLRADGVGPILPEPVRCGRRESRRPLHPCGPAVGSIRGKRRQPIVPTPLSVCPCRDGRLVRAGPCRHPIIPPRGTAYKRWTVCPRDLSSHIERP
jgi:hypothetical protein